MSKYYDGALVMPKGHAVMSEEEMTYVEGGETLAMSRIYLNKSYCETVAKSYSGWTNVSTDQLKKEIYGHAYAYYKMTPAIESLSKAGIFAPELAWKTLIFSHLEDGIYIENAVDKYQLAWNIIWDL